jgi:hypothetical protein
LPTRRGGRRRAPRPPGVCGALPCQKLLGKRHLKRRAITLSMRPYSIASSAVMK